MSNKICAADNCDRKPVSKTYCLMHYKRFKKHGNANYIRKIAKKEKCTIEGCENFIQSKGLCAFHYKRNKANGTPTPWAYENKHRIFDTIEKAFFAHIDQNGDQCWEWKGSLHTKMPYGKLWFKDKCYLAHRISYEIHKGPIPDGLHVMHIVCDNPRCVNPSHLTVGTHLDNMRDCASKGRTGFKKGALPPQLPPRPGETNPNAKVSDIQAAEIKDKFRKGYKASDLMVQYGLSKTHIYRYKRAAMESK